MDVKYCISATAGQLETSECSDHGDTLRRRVQRLFSGGHSQSIGTQPLIPLLYLTITKWQRHGHLGRPIAASLEEDVHNQWYIEILNSRLLRSRGLHYDVVLPRYSARSSSVVPNSTVEPLPDVCE